MYSFIFLSIFLRSYSGFPVTEIPDPDFSDFEIPDTVDQFDPVTVVEMFIQFERAYQKEYRSPLEQAKARAVFQQNVIQIIRLNQQYSNNSLKFGINYYTDFSDLEFAEKVANLHPDAGIRNSESTEFELNSEAEIPENFDWRNRKNTVTGVGNQGYCGCSWGHTVSSIVQSVFSIKHSRLLNLSEQQLCDCAQGGNSGCSGGNLRDGFEYVKQNGLILVTDYQKITDFCHVLDQKKTIKVSDYHVISPTTPECLQNALLKNGPIGVEFKVSNSFRHYKSGIFTLDDCENQQFIGWHSVAIIGYGIDEKSGQEFWIGQNSWSPSFGEHGFFRIAKGADLCEIESKLPIFVELQNSKQYN